MALWRQAGSSPLGPRSPEWLGWRRGPPGMAAPIAGHGWPEPFASRTPSGVPARQTSQSVSHSCPDRRMGGDRPGPVSEVGQEGSTTTAEIGITHKSRRAQPSSLRPATRLGGREYLDSEVCLHVSRPRGLMTRVDYDPRTAAIDARALPLRPSGEPCRPHSPIYEPGCAFVIGTKVPCGLSAPFPPTAWSASAGPRIRRRVAGSSSAIRSRERHPAAPASAATRK